MLMLINGNREKDKKISSKIRRYYKEEDTYMKISIYIYIEIEGE